MRSSLKSVAVLVIAIVVMGSALFLMFRANVPRGGGSQGEAVGVIYIEGVIQAGSGATGFESIASAESIIRQIHLAKEDPEVKAVVLRLNTPGGAAAASQEVAGELEKLKASGKKVVASMGDVAASGGYWIACVADIIVANPGSTTGSIGVIWQTADLQELYNKLGIAFEVFKSGSYKDMGSSSRELTPEERDIIQGMVDDIFEQFIDIVSKGRNMPRSTVVNLADGRVYTGRQAKALGLVDEIGNIQDAFDIAAELAGISGEYNIKEFGKATPFERLLSFFGASSLKNTACRHLGELLYSNLWAGRRSLIAP